ncbi:MAG: dihydroorotase family protein [Caldilineaceae bacterium]|nr:dihydroorotase family protein [Caldilineaceae bacterium]
MLDIAIKGGTVASADGLFPADVGIENDQIAIVAQTGALPPARTEIVADEMLVMPGVIDIHFHVRAPSYPERGTFVTESSAAAAGGVTTVLEMPISNPCCATVDVFESRRRLGEAESLVNFGLYGAPGLLQQDEILGMAEAGACGFKIFTHAIQPGREDEFEGLCLEDESELYEVLEMVKETGLLVSFHAENERLIQLFGNRIRQTGRTDPAAFVESRPPVVEAMAVAELAVLCDAVNTHVHIAHVSSAAALDVLQRAQQAGLPMTGETCPHYLFFTAEDMDRHGPFAMIKPPLRSEADQAALWGGLLDGSLSAITTDHSPFTLAEKERGLNNIWQGAIGAPGVEALLPGVMTEALTGRLTVADAVRFLSSQPAQLFNLYPRKGVIRVGADADVVVYDPRPSGTFDSSKWFSKAKAVERLYNGRFVQGRVQTTIINGIIAYCDGAIKAEPGTGRFVRP